jgi:hypothetical protein|tara:strand:+ start:37 stop:1236 length:1200 start_codon:yes stop_codon:yes gene_type:complete
MTKKRELTKKKGENSLTIPKYIKATLALDNTPFFVPTYRRDTQTTTRCMKIGEKTLPDGTKANIMTHVNLSKKWGLPNTQDLDYFKAFEKYCDEIVNRDGTFDLPIKITTKKLINYAGRKESTREWQEVKKWLKRMNATQIEGIWNAKSGEFEEGAVTVFATVYTKGQKLKDGSVAGTNYIWPNIWFLENYYYRHVRLIDHNFYKNLIKPISKALYSRLATGWYASGGKPYKKSYNTLTKEFFIKEHTKFSYIKQQLDPSHKELQNKGFLEKWEYLPAKNKKDYVIVWYAGAKYHKDQEARIVRKQTAERITGGTKKFPTIEPLNDRQEYLVEDILKVCKDNKNKVAYEKIVRERSEQLIRVSLTETRMAIHEGRIKKSPGAYFTDTIKQLERMRTGVK